MESNVLNMLLFLLRAFIPALALLNRPVPRSLSLKVLPVVFCFGLGKLEFRLVALAV